MKYFIAFILINSVGCATDSVWWHGRGTTTELKYSIDQCTQKSQYLAAKPTNQNKIWMTKPYAVSEPHFQKCMKKNGWTN